MGQERKKILVVRLSSLGDVALATAIFPNLKAHWPSSEVSVLTRVPYAPLFDSNPYVDHVLVLNESKQSFYKLAKEIRAEKYDVIIDLHANLRSWFIRLLAGAPWTTVVDKATWARRKRVWLKRSSPRLERSVREKILDCLAPLEVPIVQAETQLFPAKGTSLLNTFSIDPEKRLIGIAPGARHATKRWFPDRFAEAANRLGAFSNSLILILGDKSDRAVAEEVSKGIQVPCKNLTGWTSLKELISIMSHLSLLLTNDSGLLHVAEALKVPTVSVFGPTVRDFGFAPYRDTSRVVEVTNLPCRPCTLHGDERCPLRHHKCMDEVDTNAVLFAASSLLDKEAVGPQNGKNQ